MLHQMDLFGFAYLRQAQLEHVWLVKTKLYVVLLFLETHELEYKPQSLFLLSLVVVGAHCVLV